MDRLGRSVGRGLRLYEGGQVDQSRLLISRRALIGGGVGLIATAALGGELAVNRVIPGKLEVDVLLGRCSVGGTEVDEGALGPTVTGEFVSKARGGATVGWTISYPPGSRVGDRLPVVLALHGYHGSHFSPIGHISPVGLLAAKQPGPLPVPVVIAAADGGNGYWHAQGNDDPQRMLIEEFLPLCARHGLSINRIGVTGTSMGGYGALLFAETFPSRVAAVAAISPAVFSSYDDARAANPGAFSSQADFDAHNVIAHAGQLEGMAVRVAVGDDDPLRPAVDQLHRKLPPTAVFVQQKGCHTSGFFTSQELPSLDFVRPELR